MIIFTFILGFILSVSARHSSHEPEPYRPEPPQYRPEPEPYHPEPQQYHPEPIHLNPYQQKQTYCDTKTKYITVTNTWANPDLYTVTSTQLVHDHTVVPITNTVIIPYTTLSTLVITHLNKIHPETTVSTIWQTKLHPTTETRTHTAIKTLTTRIDATETKVEYMTLTKTLVKPSTTTITTERLVKTHLPQIHYEDTTVTHWETSTHREPVYVTWNNFRTTTVHDTVYVTKGHAKPAHAYTTITKYDTVTKCHGKAYN